MAVARRVTPARVEESVDLTDVPAAVVCASCGEADCPGCAEDRASKTASGVVVFVPWERPQTSLWARLWGTTRASTQGAEAFFAAMPQGPLFPALTFALAAETIAVGTSVVACGAFGALALYLVLPVFATAIVTDSRWQMLLARIGVASWAAFTLVLVGAHALHGAMLHEAARRQGAKGDIQRALRFGLYAAGWDMATCPFGLMVAFLTGGPRGLLEARVHAFRTPGRATAAMLRGLYGLDGPQAQSARTRSMTFTMMGSIVAIVAAFLFVIWAA